MCRHVLVFFLSPFPHSCSAVGQLDSSQRGKQRTHANEDRERLNGMGGVASLTEAMVAKYNTCVRPHSSHPLPSLVVRTRVFRVPPSHSPTIAGPADDPDREGPQPRTSVTPQSSYRVDTACDVKTRWMHFRSHSMLVDPTNRQVRHIQVRFNGPEIRMHMACIAVYAKLQWYMRAVCAVIITGCVMPMNLNDCAVLHCLVCGSHYIIVHTYTATHEEGNTQRSGWWLTFPASLCVGLCVIFSFSLGFRI